MRRILVTAVSGDIGNGILKILQETEAELYGCDVNRYAAGMDKVKQFFVVPPAVEENYIQTLLEICENNNIRYLIPVNEREVEVISERRELFERQGIYLIMQSREMLDICLDKYRCMEFLRENNILVPDTWLATEKRSVTERCILKPRKSNGSKDIRIMETGETLKEEEKREQNLMQIFVPGEREYTVGIFSDGKISNIISFKRKLKNGYSDYVELTELSEINEIAKKIRTVFDLHGYINVQMKEWQGKYYIFEINPRISGTVYFRHMLEYKDVLWWLDYVDKKEVPQYQCPYEHAVGLRELKEKFVEMRRK